MATLRTLRLGPSCGRLPVTDPIPAAELLGAGECSAACLLAHPSAPCTCRCGGIYHAALLDAGVPRATGWWDAIPGGFKPQQWHRDYPVLATAADFRAHWRGPMMSAGSAYVRPASGGKWAVHAFAITAWHDGKLILQEGLFEGLVLAHRCAAASTGQDPSIYGFRTWQEAQAAARLLRAIDWMWTDDVLPCLRELDRALRSVPHPRLAGTFARAEEYERRCGIHDAMWDDPLTGPFLKALNPYRTGRALPAGADAAR